jgi:hypothetical protein
MTGPMTSRAALLLTALLALPTLPAAAFELQQHDAGRIRPGSPYAAEFPEQQPVDGPRILRLADLFDLVKRAGGNGRVGFEGETKVSPLEPGATLPPAEFARPVVAGIRTMYLSLLAEARALGLTVNPWTVNDPAMLDKLVAMGVDGLISDRPDRAQQALARRKRAVRAP